MELMLANRLREIRFSIARKWFSHENDPRLDSKVQFIDDIRCEWHTSSICGPVNIIDLQMLWAGIERSIFQI